MSFGFQLHIKGGRCANVVEQMDGQKLCAQHRHQASKDKFNRNKESGTSTCILMVIRFITLIAHIISFKTCNVGSCIIL